MPGEGIEPAISSTEILDDRSYMNVNIVFFEFQKNFFIFLLLFFSNLMGMGVVWENTLITELSIFLK